MKSKVLTICAVALFAVAAVLVVTLFVPSLRFWDGLFSGGGEAHSGTVTTAKHEVPDIEVTYDTAAAEEVLTYMNNGRMTAGLSPLTMDNGAMMEAAKIRAKEITVYFAHERLNGDSNFTVFEDCGIKYRFAGENLASGQPNAATVYNSWWNSAEHLANMHGENFHKVSIVAMNYEGTVYWVQLFRD